MDDAADHSVERAGCPFCAAVDGRAPAHVVASDDDTVTILTNSPASTGHLHVHLVPRWHGDGSIGWPAPPVQPPDPDEVLARLTA